MMEHDQSRDGLILTGLDGANPLAFLAALGALRGLTLAWPERWVRLSWVARDVWRPRLHVDGGSLTEEEALDGLQHFIEMRPGHEALEIGDNLKVQAEKSRGHALAAVDAASASPETWAEADFLASFGCDAVTDKSDFIQDTALRTLSGAGHQHFLKTMRQLAENTTRDGLRRCLFGPWMRPDRRLSLRWDPEDDRRYALQWRNPTASGEEPRTECGANRLAFEALPLFPVAPVGRSLRTTGFSGSSSQNTRWTWPVWDPPADLDTVRSMLALRQLQDSAPDRNELAAMGVREVFRSRRLTIGKYRNFTPSRPV